MIGIDLNITNYISINHHYSYLVQSTCEIKKLNLDLGAFSETSLCILMFPCLSDMSQWLRNNCVITGSPERGSHVVRFTAQIPLRVCKTPLYIKLARAWNRIRHQGLFSLRWTLLIYSDQFTSPRLLQITPGHHQPPCWIDYGYDNDTDIVLQPLNNVREKPRDRQTRWFLCYRGFAFWWRQRAVWYWWSVNENSLKYKIENLYENLTISQTFMEIDNKWSTS